MTPVDMSVDFLEAKKAETTEWLEEAEKVVSQYEKVREVDAALHGREYKPKVATNGELKKLEKQISELESTLGMANEREADVREWAEHAKETIARLEAELRKVPPALTLTPDMMPQTFESHAMRRVKSVSDQPFVTLPNYVLDGYSVGEMFKVIRRGDTIYLIRDHIQDIKEGTPADPAERQPAASEEPIDVPVTRKPDAPPIEETETEPEVRARGTERKSPVKLTVEELRDWVVAERSGLPFGRKDVCEKFGVTDPTAARKLSALVERGILKVEKVPNKGTPPRDEYTYAPPSSANTPRNRPVHDTPNGGGGGRQAQVPGTGKPHGPAPTPGKLRKQQAKAARVKHKPVKGVRL